TGSLRWITKRQSPVSYSSPIVWPTDTGKQVVAAGHARLIGYDLQSGAERWSVAGMPAGTCSSPVAANGHLYFAGTSGESGDADVPMPTYDSFLKDLDLNKDGVLTHDEADKAFEGFFDNQDTNKDGKFTRDEWDATVHLFSEGKSVALAV